MNRWIVPTALVLAASAHAQVVVRTAPADVKAARLVVTTPPQITIDGQPDRLSPGARIRNTQNLVVLSGSLVNQPLPVVYRRDPAGLVHEVWILTAEEYARLARAGDGNGDGARQFAELLSAIFAARR